MFFFYFPFKLNISQDIVRSIFDFSGMKQDEKIIEACVGDVKRSLDRDKDGNITKEEFINNARFVITSLNYLGPSSTNEISRIRNTGLIMIF